MKYIEEQYGEIIPDEIPGTHRGFNQCQNIKEGISLYLHRRLITRLTENSRQLTHGMNIAKVPDPCVLKTDGFSSGVKSMEPFLVKIFLNAESWQVSHELMRVIPTYGSFKFQGKVYERGKTGAGLFNTFICAFTSKTFPNSDCPPIGLTMYKRSVIKFVMDNGSGNLHVSKKVERTKSLQTFCEEFDPSAMFA